MVQGFQKYIFVGICLHIWQKYEDIGYFQIIIFVFNVIQCSNVI